MSGTDRWGSTRDWRPGRAWSMRDGLDLLFDHMDHVVYEPPPELPPDPLPLSTGIYALDRVLGGGLRLGQVAVVEAEVAAQSRALLGSVARAVKRRTLLDTGSAFAATVAMLAGQAQVPATLVRSGQLSESDWDAIVRAVRRLANLDLWLASAESLGDLGHATARHRVDVVIVEDIDRFGPPISVLPWLAQLAATRWVTVLASTPHLGDLPPWALERTARVAMAPHGLAGRAALARADDLDALLVAQVKVDLLAGTVR